MWFSMSLTRMLKRKKEKKFWKGKNAKVSFKKSGFTSVPETEESSEMKPSFKESASSVTFLDISKQIALSSKTGLRKRRKIIHWL